MANESSEYTYFIISDGKTIIKQIALTHNEVMAEIYGMKVLKI